jgi:hypothetical protein
MHMLCAVIVSKALRYLVLPVILVFLASWVSMLVTAYILIHLVHLALSNLSKKSDNLSI